MAEFFGGLNAKECGAMFKLIDSDKSGVVDYTEFIAATMESSFQYREDLCWSAFRVFDLDGELLFNWNCYSAVLPSPGGSEW